jgi:hypothetical protein
MVGKEFVLAVIVGAVLALPYLLYARRVKDSRRLFAIGLVIAASVYVPLAVFRGTPGDSLTELGGVVLFGILAFLGIRRSPYFLAAGWVSHVSWDLLLHPVDVGASSYAPWWYPVICIGFDLLVGGALLGGSWQQQRHDRMR